MTWQHFSYHQLSVFSIFQPLLFFFQISPLLSISLFYFIIFFTTRCSKGIQRLAASMNISNAVFCVLVNLSSSERPDADVQLREGIESKHNQSRLVCLWTSVQLNMNQTFDWVTLERQPVKNKHSKQIKWEADAELNLRGVMKQTQETNRQQTCLRCPSSTVLPLCLCAYVRWRTSFGCVSLLCSRLLSVCFLNAFCVFTDF